MASYTTNLNLKKPAGSENVAIGDINNNMDTIDQAYGTLNSNIEKFIPTAQTGSVSIASLISGLSLGDVARYRANPSTVFTDLVSDSTMYYAVVTIYKVANNAAQLEVVATTSGNIPMYKRGYYENGSFNWGSWI